MEPQNSFKAKRGGSGRLGKQEQLLLYPDKIEKLTPSFGARNRVAIRYDEIASVKANLPGIGYALLSVESTGGQKLIINGLTKQDAAAAKTEIEARMASARGGATPSASVADELERLSALRERDDLTDIEFEAAKRRALEN